MKLLISRSVGGCVADLLLVFQTQLKQHEVRERQVRVESMYKGP